MLKLHVKKMQIKELRSHICETANDNTRFLFEGGDFGIWQQNIYPNIDM